MSIQRSERLVDACLPCLCSFISRASEGQAHGFRAPARLGGGFVLSRWNWVHLIPLPTVRDGVIELHDRRRQIEAVLTRVRQRLAGSESLTEALFDQRRAEARREHEA